MHGSLLDAISNLLAGRFVRARKAAEVALAQEHSLVAGGHAAYEPPRAASAERPTYSASRGAPGRQGAARGRREPPGRRTRARRKPLP